MAFNTPILILAFNRPELTSALISKLRPLAPSVIYVSVDGPRLAVESDLEKVQRVREVFNLIDWPCEVKTNYRSENLGCKNAVSKAITWIFENEERAIILEDDIDPSIDFLMFCSDMLECFKDDNQVFSISGTNFAPKLKLSNPDASYRFSSVTNIWGWGTWRRSWDKYDPEIRNWRKNFGLFGLWKSLNGSLLGTIYWALVFQHTAYANVDTWDIQWVVSQLRHRGVSVVPNVNLNANVGFGVGATHTQNTPGFLLPVEAMPSDRTKPSCIDVKADNWLWYILLDQLYKNALRKLFVRMNLQR